MLLEATCFRLGSNVKAESARKSSMESAKSWLSGKLSQVNCEDRWMGTVPSLFLVSHCCGCLLFFLTTSLKLKSFYFADPLIPGTVQRHTQEILEWNRCSESQSVPSAAESLLNCLQKRQVFLFMLALPNVIFLLKIK